MAFRFYASLKFILFFIFFIGQTFAVCLYSQVSGVVFRDLDNNGTQDAGELLEPGIVVKAYDSGGNLAAQTSTSATLDGNGDNYSFLGLTLPIQLKFELPSYLFNSRGAAGGTEIQYFTASNDNANLAVQYPNFYCQSNPDVIIPCYVSGNPEGGGTGGSSDALVRFPYTSSGTGTAPTHVSSASEIGTVWGSAYQRESKTLILAEFLKRHCGLEASGLGALYTVDLTSAPGTAASYINVENFGLDIGSSVIASRPTLPVSATSASNDAIAFDNMGKVGMGSADLSDDGSVLWFVNLYEKKIVSFQIGNPVKSAGSVMNSDFESFLIPDPGCTNGQFRPWAINFHEGKIYVGGVCSGEDNGSTSDLFAYVYKFDPSTETWEASAVASFSLDYPKGDVHSSYTSYDNWEPWVADFSDIYDAGSAGTPSAIRKIRPQAILTDIVIDKRGNMILGFSDRTGHQTGRLQYGTSGTTLYNGYVGGDILMMKSNGNGGWTLENNATFSGGPTGSGANNGQGPGGGEFFSNELYSTIHSETMQGGLFYHPGLDEIMANQMDPLDIWTGGVVRHDASNGASSNSLRYQIYDTNTSDGTFGKANGLGLLQLVCDALPLEVGNIVWEDTDGDGIQDAGESGISGLIVQLYENGTLVGSTTTDANGNYFFTSSNVNLNGASGLKYDTDYEIRIDTTQSGFTGLGLTITDGGSDDLRDSDGSASGSNAIKTFTTGMAGQNNHAFDFGFAPLPCEIAIQSATPSACDPGTNTYSLDVVVTYANQPSGNIQVNTNQGGTISVAQTSSPQTITLTGLTANGTQDINVTAEFVNEPTCMDTRFEIYDAPASCVPLPCMITVNSVVPTACDPLNDHYSLQIEIVYANPPVGDITLQTEQGASTTFTPDGTSPDLVTFSGLTADGVQDIDVSATFDNDNSCTHTASDAYDAPASCIPVCSEPSAILLEFTPSTCNGNSPNNDGRVLLDNITDSDKIGISTEGAATYDGPVYANAAPLLLDQNILENLPNSGAIYIVRFFNGADDCFVDTTLTVEPVCCPTTSNLSATICEGTSYFFDGQNLTTAGSYQDTLTNAGGCDSILILILTVQDYLSAGLAGGGSPTTLCEATSGLSSIDLYEILTGEDAGGTWTDESGSPAGANFNAAAGTLDPNGLAAGTYIFEYTQNNTPPCDPNSTQVSVIIENCCPPKVCLPVTVNRN